MKENMRLAFQGIWLHKMRSILTMLGIVIGIAAIIAIVSTIKGTNEQIKESLVGSGNNIVEVVLSREEDGDEDDEEEKGQISAISLIEDSDIENIKGIATVQDAARYTTRSYSDNIYYQDHPLEDAAVYGVSENYMDIYDYQIVNGRSFAKRDYASYRKVVLIDETAVSALFPNENPVGKILEISGEPFTIIGTVKEKSTSKMTINSLDDYYTYVDESSGKVFMPETSWPIVYQYDELQNVAVKAISTDDMSTAGQQTEKYLKNRFQSQNIRYHATDVMQTVKSLQQLSEGTNRQLIWIASISLLVGGIGVMNIMLVSVTERTREIGLKKSIGARKKRILLQFLTEAAVLGCIGGVLGVISGIVLAETISKLSGAPVAISIPAAIGAVAFSIMIGLIFGLLPSIQAANLNPIEALRRE